MKEVRLLKIIMPQVGMTMQEGMITEWNKKNGEAVEKGEILYSFTTEKLENEIEAPVSGILKIFVNEGESAKCGVEIAEII